MENINATSRITLILSRKTLHLSFDYSSGHRQTSYEHKYREYSSLIISLNIILK